MGGQLGFVVVEMMRHSMKGYTKEHNLESREQGMTALGVALEEEGALELR